MTPSADDWQAIASTNVADSGETLKSLVDDVGRQRQDAEISAKAFLARADSLHFDFTQGDLHARVVDPPRFGRLAVASTRYSHLQADGQTIRFLRQLEIILNKEDSTANASPNGEFKVILRRLSKFPNGWRAHGGIEWESFPLGTVDDKTVRQMAIEQKAANPGNSGLTDKDDPALLKLGETLVRFLHERDTNIYAKETLINSDMLLTELQKNRQTPPSRQEVDKQVDRSIKEQIESARALLTYADEAGINLKNAELKIAEASVYHLSRSAVEAVTGEQFKLKFTVKGEGKSKTGHPISGDYVVSADEVSRFGDEWKLGSGVHWRQMPTGVLDEKVTATMELENYIGEHQTLPPTTAAPDIQFTMLDGGKMMKLSDLRGKVIVLDFWATWCVPCQKPMADLQEMHKAHPNWGDKVAIVPLSIDDTLDMVRRHVNKRAWTNTFNVWAGHGGWQSAPAKAFRITSVPTTYIIDASGKILEANHPGTMHIGELVDAALKP